MSELRIPITVDASGDAVVYGERSVCARLKALLYDRGDLDGGADLTLTTDQYAVVETIFSVTDAGAADIVWYPRHLVHNNASGAALLGTSGGDRDPPLMIGRPVLTVAQGGVSKSGALTLIFED